MNMEVIFDFLLFQSKGDIFYFDSRTCPLFLIKEAILQSFQICNLTPETSELPSLIPSGIGSGWGYSNGNGEGAGESIIGGRRINEGSGYDYSVMEVILLSYEGSNVSKHFKYGSPTSFPVSETIYHF